MQASREARPSPMRIVITVASELLLDLDLAVEDRQLRRLHLERLPGMRIALEIGRGHLVGEGAGGIVLRHDPRGGPERISRLPWRMATEACAELLPVRQLDLYALQPFVVEHLAGFVLDTKAPDHLLQMLELVIEHASRRYAGLVAALQVAVEEQLAVSLCARAGETQQGQC